MDVKLFLNITPIHLRSVSAICLFDALSSFARCQNQAKFSCSLSLKRRLHRRLVMMVKELFGFQIFGVDFLSELAVPLNFTKVQKAKVSLLFTAKRGRDRE